MRRFGKRTQIVIFGHFDGIFHAVLTVNEHHSSETEEKYFTLSSSLVLDFEQKKQHY